jgi:type IV secretory pathway TrbF-like protein
MVVKYGLNKVHFSVKTVLQQPTTAFAIAWREGGYCN